MPSDNERLKKDSIGSPDAPKMTRSVSGADESEVVSTSETIDELTVKIAAKPGGRSGSDTADGGAAVREQIHLDADTGSQLIGMILADKYEIVELIGKGGMSSVFRARHLATKKLVAVKVMHAFLLADPNAVRRFQQEAMAASKLDHPHVVSVHDLGVTENGLPYLVMDYLSGRSLADVIAGGGKLDVWRCLQIFIQTCEGLAAAHAAGIVHRDMKPSNIMLVRAGENTDFVKVVDFGIARILPQEGGELSRLTATGEIFGSPLYMSPEQCQGEPMDALSDVYSMGCLMYESLTGKPPLEGRNMLETMYKQTNQMPAALTGLDADVRLVQRLDGILRKAMAKKPQERFASMADLRRELEEVAATGGQGSKALARMELNASQAYRQLLNKLGRSYRLVFAGAVLLFVCLIVIAFLCQPLLSIYNLKPAERSLPLVPVVETFDSERAQQVEYFLMANEQATRYTDLHKHFYAAKALVSYHLRRKQWQAARDDAVSILKVIPEGIPKRGMDVADLLSMLSLAELMTQDWQNAYKDSAAAIKIYGANEGCRIAGELEVVLDKPVELIAFHSAGESAWKLGMVNEARRNFGRYLAGATLAKQHVEKVGTYDSAPDLFSIGNFFLTMAQQAPRGAVRDRQAREAIDVFARAQSEWSHSADKQELNSGITLNQTGLAYELLGDSKQAEVAFAAAFSKLSRRGASDHDLAIVLLNESDAQWKNGKIWDAVQNASKSKELLARAADEAAALKLH